MKTSRKTRRPLALALALATGLFASALVLPTPLRAQASSTTETASEKIQLQTQAIDAKTAGNYAEAKSDLQKIIALDPKDPSNADVQRQIDVIDAALASQAAGKPTIFDASKGSAPANTTVAVSADASATGNTTAAAPAAAPAPSAQDKAALAAAQAMQKQTLANINAAIKKAQGQAAAGNFDDARGTLDGAMQMVPQGLAYADVRNDIHQESVNTWYLQAVAAYNANDLPGATDALGKYNDAAGGADSRSNSLQSKIIAAKNDPLKQSVKSVASPGFLNTQEKVNELLVRGRAQFLYGDFDGAQETFNDVTNYDPDNVEAKAYALKIDEMLHDRSHIDWQETRTRMLRSVDEDWVLPTYSAATPTTPTGPTKADPQMEKLNKIFIPSVNIDVPTPLDVVVQVLHEQSVRYDPDGKGINFFVYPPSNNEPMPKVTLPGLNGMSLAQLLRLACGSSTPVYGYNSEDGVITLREGNSLTVTNSDFIQKRIPLSEGAQTELGLGSASSAASSTTPATTTDPFATANATANTTATPAPATDSSSNSAEGSQVMQKFVDNNIPFPAGSRVTMLGNNSISVVNTPQNIELLENFLRTLGEVKQVQIEARFIDITQGALKSFGTSWTVNNARLPNDFLNTGTGSNNNLRSLSNAFLSGSAGAAPTVVTGLPAAGSANVSFGGVDFLGGGSSVVVPQVIPSPPGQINTGANTTDLFGGVVSWLDGYRIGLVIDALDQEQGSDLMASPKLTVQDGSDAKILVAQEFYYPRQFSGVTSTVSPGSGGNTGGGSGVAINAGTPSEFSPPYEIGVQMKVQPNVQPDDSIKMYLAPNVTEFEGFIEYGSASIAIQGNITAVVPSGIIQPIFDVRTVETNVTIYDGATVIMGGLTRDEVETVNDKVPVLGDIPLLGRMFQSKGETTQKRNLMIFVTADLIGPGGSPTGSAFRTAPGTIFSNPTLYSPAGPIQRNPPVPPPIESAESPK